jgi:uncharacterized protein (DUF58 family)
MAIKQLELNLIPQLRKQAVAAKRRVLSRVLEGSWTALLKGRGMEFAGFRQYTYGDDASRIDWNATLRTKEVLVREFEEYKTVNVFFVLDLSDSMLFTRQAKLKCEFAAELMFNLSTAIVDAGDSVGYVLFSDRIIAKRFPSLGRDVIYRLAQDLSDGRNYGGKREFKLAMRLVNSLLHQRSLIIIISDFIDLPEGWERYIKMFSMQYDLIGIMVRDPHDSQLPDLGLQMEVQDPSNPQERLLIDAKQYAAAYAAEVEREERYVREVFEKAKAGFLRVEPSQETFDILIQYFRRRTSQVKS